MTQIYNDTNIPDYAKLVAFANRGGHIQFSMGSETTVQAGEETNIHHNVLTLDCPFLGSPQFKIVQILGKWVLTNLCKDNQTFVGNEELKYNHDVELVDGEVIRIVKNERTQAFLFQDKFDPAVEWRSFLLINRNRVTPIFSEEALQKMAMDDELSDRSKYPHITVFYHEGSWCIDTKHINVPVTVNGNKVKGSRKLNLYDVIRIGESFFVYFPGRLAYSVGAGSRKKLIAHIKDRTISTGYKKTKTLLKDIRLTINPGSLVLLLGGSGAGKTTLINAITGYEKANAKVLNGGVDVYENYNQMKYEIGVVPQQDLLRSTDTVYMTLYNAAQLRLPSTMTHKELKEAVDSVLKTFGLQSVSQSLVKSLSGGQRKRLSIGVEYIGDPSLFILDEPDSGLDGVIARELIHRLRKIADSGKVVIVITHTPDRVIDLFDHIIVLAKDSNKVGRLAFYGTIDDAKKFFGKEKMEDIVKSVNTVDEGGEGRADELIARYAEMQKGSVDNG